jgi:hypothetical protein
MSLTDRPHRLLDRAVGPFEDDLVPEAVQLSWQWRSAASDNHTRPPETDQCSHGMRTQEAQAAGDEDHRREPISGQPPPRGTVATRRPRSCRGRAINANRSEDNGLLCITVITLLAV